MSKRFHIALSFPDEHRSFALDVANALADKLTRERVFYDEWYAIELRGSGGDLKLQSMYEDADCVVAFFSEHYDKWWSSMDWETIRGILLQRRKEHAVIPVHLDDTEVVGWSAVNFGIRLRQRTAKQIAEIILRVLEMRLSGSTEAVSAVPPSAPILTDSMPTACPSSWELPIWNEKLDYLQQQEAITADAVQKSALQKQIEETKRRFDELRGLPTTQSRRLDTPTEHLQPAPDRVSVAFVLQHPSAQTIQELMSKLNTLGMEPTGHGGATVSARVSLSSFQSLFGVETYICRRESAESRESWQTIGLSLRRTSQGA